MLEVNSDSSKDWSKNNSNNSSKVGKSFWGGLLGGLSLSLLLIASGWILYRHRTSIPQLGSALGKVLPENAPLTPQEISDTKQVSSPSPAARGISVGSWLVCICRDCVFSQTAESHLPQQQKMV